MRVFSLNLEALRGALSGLTQRRASLPERENEIIKYTLRRVGIEPTTVAITIISPVP